MPRAIPQAIRPFLFCAAVRASSLKISQGSRNWLKLKWATGSQPCEVRSSKVSIFNESAEVRVDHERGIFQGVSPGTCGRDKGRGDVRRHLTLKIAFDRRVGCFYIKLKRLKSVEPYHSENWNRYRQTRRSPRLNSLTGRIFFDKDELSLQCEEGPQRRSFLICLLLWRKVDRVQYLLRGWVCKRLLQKHYIYTKSEKCQKSIISEQIQFILISRKTHNVTLAAQNFAL